MIFPYLIVAFFPSEISLSIGGSAVVFMRTAIRSSAVAKARKKKQLRPWEHFLTSFRSNADWAANGRYVPLYVVHGLQDGPMHSQVLVDRYRKLRYPVKYETPDLGHNVWKQTYEERRIFDHFRGLKRTRHPRKVTLHTARLRYRSSHWLRIDGTEDYGKWTRADGVWSAKNEIEVKTENTAALTLLEDEKLSKGRPATVLSAGTGG